MTVSTIYVNKDTWVATGSGNINHGIDSSLLVVSPESTAATRRRALLEFNTSGIASGSVVSNAVLHIYLSDNNYSTDGGYYYFKRMLSQFSEYVVTWNDQPSHTSTNAAYTNMTSTGWQTITVTDLVQDAITNVNYTGIKVIGTSIFDNIKISSRETSNDAYLVITYTLTNDYYVKTTGNDSLSGTSWANAWKTINKAATTVTDGKTVHIGFGTYNAEPAANKIAPQNVGTVGIYYLPETATTGGGTGTVSIEQNA